MYNVRILSWRIAHIDKFSYKYMHKSKNKNLSLLRIPSNTPLIVINNQKTSFNSLNRNFLNLWLVATHFITIYFVKLIILRGKIPNYLSFWYNIKKNVSLSTYLLNNLR